MGDAKDSAHETASTSDTVARIRGYATEFAGMVKSGETRGGLFAIATNSEAAAKDWIPVLNAMMTEAGLKDPEFRLEVLSDATLVVVW